MPEERDALVGNAADKSQVADAKRKEKLRRERELDDLRAVLALPEGRRLAWRILAHCNAFASIYDDGPRIRYNAGRQDVGHFLLDEINDAEPEALFTMMREATARTNA